MTLIGEVLTDKQISIVKRHIKKKDTHALREYLNSLKSQLEEKEVVPDYLYYLLCYKYNLL